MKTVNRIIFTCGGTAGHVNPALALAGRMRELNPKTDILFVGAERGLEKDLIPKAGYQFKTVHISSFHRSGKLGELKHNFISVCNLMRAPHEARHILEEFQPDCVVGTGGYASYPMVKEAAKAGIPTAVHESNMVPGLTTKMLEPYADCIMVGFEECRQHYKNPNKVIVTGTPVRGDFFRLTKQEAKRNLNVDDSRPLIVSFWGSLGASHMNRQMVDFLKLESLTEPFHHIHGAGENGYTSVCQGLKDQGVAIEQCEALSVRPYIYDMATVMRAADLVICRAGASTISELTALGKAALIVPSPYVTNNHQEKNARVLEQQGGARVITEPECSGQKLYATACSILLDKERRREMEESMKQLGVTDATDRIYDAVLAVTK